MWRGPGELCWDVWGEGGLRHGDSGGCRLYTVRGWVRGVGGGAGDGMGMCSKGGSVQYRVDIPASVVTRGALVAGREYERA